MTDDRLRVAAVGYLNARPLWDGLDREPASARVRLDCAPPSEVARRIAEDEADIALMPVAAAATLGDLRFVRGSAIGARGAVRKRRASGGAAHRRHRRARGRPLVADQRGPRAPGASCTPRRTRAAALGLRAAGSHRARGWVTGGAGHRRSRARRRGAFPRRRRLGGGVAGVDGLTLRVRGVVRPPRRAVRPTTNACWSGRRPRAWRGVRASPPSTPSAPGSPRSR